jgi:hypothetical protein
LIGVVALAAVAYVLMLGTFKRDAQMVQHLYRIGPAVSDHVDVFAQIMSVSPANDSMTIRYAFKPAGRLASRLNSPAQDLNAYLAGFGGYQTVRLKAGQPPRVFNVERDLDGGHPGDYPFGAYTSHIGVRVFKASRPGSRDFSVPVPVVVHYEEELGDFAIDPRLAAESEPDSLVVDLAIRRSTAVRTFAMVTYGAIVLIALSVFMTACLTLLGKAEPDFSRMLWSGAMLFALPAIRNSLPDSPPLGIQADFYIFLWAQALVAVSMVSMTIMWFAYQLKPKT